MTVTDLATLLQTMGPVLHEGVYVYAFSGPGMEVGGVDAIAIFREPEGTTFITREAEAVRAGLTIVFRAGWITLGVNSDLTAVGFTAAFSGALAKAGISCNVVAAVRHDHLFVPVERAGEALDILKSLCSDCIRSHQATKR